ncbi:MAG: hypothetical protein KUG67_00395 [Proteobacteria bacterium]|nr:hypothetical protein [Pseudomonadota bacterium]
MPQFWLSWIKQESLSPSGLEVCLIYSGSIRLVELTASHALKNNDPALNETAFRDSREQEGNITLIELTRTIPINWKLSIGLSITQIKTTDPVTHITEMLATQPEFRSTITEMVLILI